VAIGDEKNRRRVAKKGRGELLSPLWVVSTDKEKHPRA